MSVSKIDPSSQSLSLADCRRPDCPLVYVNKGFEQMTGYTKEEVIGTNCRFLQGPDTDRHTVERIREAIAEGSSLIVDLLNHRKDGSRFWNRLSLRPVRTSSGVLTHFIGIQSEITRMKELEEELYGYALLLAGEPQNRS